MIIFLLPCKAYGLHIITQRNLKLFLPFCDYKINVTFTIYAKIVIQLYSLFSVVFQAQFTL